MADEVSYELVDDVNGAEFGHPESGDRVELAPGEKITVSRRYESALAQLPFLQPAAAKKSAKEEAE